MKMTQNLLEQMIAEELQTAIDEGLFDRLKARGASALDSLKAKGAELGSKAAGDKLPGLAKDLEGAQARSAASASEKKQAVLKRSLVKKMEPMHAKLRKLADEIMADAKKIGLSDKEAKSVVGGALSGTINRLETEIIKLKASLGADETEEPLPAVQKGSVGSVASKAAAKRQGAIRPGLAGIAEE